MYDMLLYLMPKNNLKKYTYKPRILRAFVINGPIKINAFLPYGTVCTFLVLANFLMCKYKWQSATNKSL